MAQRGRPKKRIEETPSEGTYLDRVSQQVQQSNQSKLSMVLGALIILVIGILIFNYFQRSKTDLGPAQTTTIEEQAAQEDASPDKLPGKYTVKEDDTLFGVAEKYYQDGSKFEEIAKANNLADVNTIEAGQVLEIPKLAESPSPTPTPTSPSETPQSPSSQIESNGLGTGGGNITIWGPKIEGNTYTVQEGDWLSTISARAYGDIFAYQKLAVANNISNPDLIFPGMVLTIPR